MLPLVDALGIERMPASNTGIALGASVLNRVDGGFPDVEAREALTAAMAGLVMSAARFDAGRARRRPRPGHGPAARRSRPRRARHAGCAARDERGQGRRRGRLRDVRRTAPGRWRRPRGRDATRRLPRCGRAPRRRPRHPHRTTGAADRAGLARCHRAHVVGHVHRNARDRDGAARGAEGRHDRARPAAAHRARRGDRACRLRCAREGRAGLRARRVAGRWQTGAHHDRRLAATAVARDPRPLHLVRRAGRRRLGHRRTRPHARGDARGRSRRRTARHDLRARRARDP